MTFDFSEIDALIDQLADDGEIAPSTRANHGVRWAVFERWCGSKGVSALPAAPSTVSAFYAALANGTHSDHGEPCSQSYLKLMRYTIGWQHHEAGYEVLPTKDESVRATYRGIWKQLNPATSTTAVMPDDMLRIQAASIPMDVQRLQDYVLAVLSLGTGSAIRELTDIRVFDVDTDVIPDEVGGSVLIRDAEGGTLAELDCQCDTDVVCAAHLTAHLRDEVAAHSSWLFPFFRTRETGLQVRGEIDHPPRGYFRRRLRSLSRCHDIVMEGGRLLWATHDDEDRAGTLRHLSPDHFGARFARTRDQVMALVAWHASLRSSEYRALRASDLERTEDGYLVTVRRSKTDQFGEGKLTSLAPAKDAVLCPVRALDRWLALTGLGRVAKG